MTKEKDITLDRKRETIIHDEDRTHDSRKFEERERQKRTIMNMFSANPYDIPPELIPADVEYLWVRESLMGETDNSNMAEMRSKG
jgi:hypothetical protein